MGVQLLFQRRELKYYLPEALYPGLISLISPYMKLDEHIEGSGEKSYCVRSLYLDTDDRKFYHEKLAGLHTRKKFRIRGYNDERSNIFFEIKRKFNDVVVKERSIGRYEELDKVLDRYGSYHPNGHRNDPELKAINNFLLFIPIMQLRPEVLVAYDREPYMGIFDDTVRLTLDRNLRCMPGRGTDLFYSGKNWTYVSNRCILELKFNHALPFFFRRIIRQLNLWAVAISKYCLCIESMREF